MEKIKTKYICKKCKQRIFIAEGELITNEFMSSFKVNYYHQKCYKKK